VIGAGSAQGRRIVANLLAGGFQGPILPVEAAVGAVAGVLAYPTVAALPLAPDLAVFAGPADAAEETLTALGARGTRVVIVVGMVRGLGDIGRRAGVRVLGPGSFGIAVPAIGLNASLGHLQPKPGRIALVSQSAALCRAVLDWAEPNGVGFSHIVGVGGYADLGFGAVLDWLARDSGTGAILLDIRAIRDRRRFFSAARAAARLRPVLAIRAGGRLADPTGRADAVLAAALRRAGVLSVTSLDDLLAAAGTLTRARGARGDDLAIVTNALGPGWMAADAALAEGIALAEPDAEDRRRLIEVLPEAEAPLPTNPPTLPNGRRRLIYVGQTEPRRLADAAAALAQSSRIGGILVVHAPTGPADADAMTALADVASSARVPLLACVMGETTARAHRQRLAAAGVPVFDGPGRAVRGFLHLVEDRHNRLAARELPSSEVAGVDPARAAQAQDTFRRVRAAGRTALTFAESAAVLNAYGIAAVPSHTVHSAEQAGAVAAIVGFPAVLKLPRAARSTARDGRSVFRDLANETAVQRAAAVLARELPPGSGAIGGVGLVVQHQVERMTELAVEVANDATFGPSMTLGVGRVEYRDLRAAAVDLPPLNLTLAHALIVQAGLDRPSIPQDDLADALVRISQLVVDVPAVARMTIDPLFAGEDGVLIGDAAIALRGDGEAASMLTIPPYPAELAGRVAIGGEMLTVRPIRPEDAEAHAAFFGRLSPEDVRYRFFAALRELSPEQIARLTQIDYDREMAFIAARDNGETVGVARLAGEPGSDTAEFAVIVQPDMKGRGLASHLMRRLIDWARSRNLTEITGQVLADNAPMLAFVRHLGFTLRRLPEQEDVFEAQLALTPAQG